MRVRPPTGSRVKLTIEPGLASKVARSAIVATGMERLVNEIAAAAQEAVPVAGADEHLPAGRQPGDLKASEQHDVILTPSGYVGVVAYTAYWAHMVHFGTRYAHPNPWLQNAALNVILGRHASGRSLAA